MRQAPTYGLANTLSLLGMRLVLPVGLLAVWHLMSLGWPDDPRLATPVGVIEGFKELIAEGDLLIGLYASVRHIFYAFVIAVVLGGGLGLVMGSHPRFDRWLGPLFHTLRPIAPYAWIPMAILWFGIGDMAVISIITYAAFFPILVNALEGARNVDKNLISAAGVLGASRSKIFRSVVLPASVPSLLVGARLGMGAAWIAVVAAELASGAQGGQEATGGLGQLMFVFYASFINLDNIVVCIIAIGAAALLSDHGLQSLYRRFTPWKQER